MKMEGVCGSAISVQWGALERVVGRGQRRLNHTDLER